LTHRERAQHDERNADRHQGRVLPRAALPVRCVDGRLRIDGVCVDAWIVASTPGRFSNRLRAESGRGASRAEPDGGGAA
jgi:hypothetical protein